MFWKRFRIFIILSSSPSLVLLESTLKCSKGIFRLQMFLFKTLGGKPLAFLMDSCSFMPPGERKTNLWANISPGDAWHSHSDELDGCFHQHRRWRRLDLIKCVPSVAPSRVRKVIFHASSIKCTFLKYKTKFSCVRVFGPAVYVPGGMSSWFLRLSSSFSGSIGRTETVTSSTCFEFSFPQRWPTFITGGHGTSRPLQRVQN